jgi:hypothetical protein
MKSKIIYFVLYLVVIAELLVVIHERDLLVESLNIDKIVTTALQKLVVETRQESNTYSVSYDQLVPATFTVYAPDLISETEKQVVQFYAEIEQSSSNLFGKNFFPEFLSTEKSDTTKRAFLTKVGDKCNLTIKTSFQDLPGNVASRLTSTNSNIVLKYYIYAKTPRILSGDISPTNMEQLFDHLLNPDSTEYKKVNEKYGIVNKDEQKKILKHIAAKLFLGLDGERLADFVIKSGINPEFGIPENAIEEIVRKANEINEKSLGIKDPDQKTKAYEEFKSVVYKHFKGKQDLGLSDSDDFYSETSNKIPVLIKFELN